MSLGICRNKSGTLLSWTPVIERNSFNNMNEYERVVMNPNESIRFSNNTNYFRHGKVLIFHTTLQTLKSSLAISVWISYPYATAG